MKAKFAEAEQGSEQWLIERIPYVTASNVAAVMAKGSGATRANYLSKKLCEIATGIPTKSYKSANMLKGNETEPILREIYEEITGTKVIERPFAYLEDEGLGGSIDGDIEGQPEGFVEFKSVMSSEQIRFISTGKIKDAYIKQLQTNMYVWEKKWCDFTQVALGDEESGELPDELKVKIVRVYRDEEMIAKIRKETAFFHNDLKELRKKLGV